MITTKFKGLHYKIHHNIIILILKYLGKHLFEKKKDVMPTCKNLWIWQEHVLTRRSRLKGKDSLTSLYPKHQLLGVSILK